MDDIYSAIPMMFKRLTPRKHVIVPLLAAVFACALASEATAEPLAPRPATVKSVSASCAGDTISGKTRVSGKLRVRLALMAKGSAKASFKATGKARILSTPKAGSYRFKFDISKLNAYAYRVDGSKTMRSKPLLAASCGPGYTVPEAPFALLLPITLLLTIGLPVLLLRRRAHVIEP
jgi:hypothetical protein